MVSMVFREENTTPPCITGGVGSLAEGPGFNANVFHDRQTKNGKNIKQTQPTTTASPSTSIVNSKEEEHYNDCINLSTANKINAANGFKLHMIDYLFNCVKQPSYNDFQKASSGIECCSKIYMARVDNLAADVYKIASDMAKAKSVRPTQKASTPGDKDGKEKQTGDDEQSTAAKQLRLERAKRKGKTITTNKSSITSKKPPEIAFVNNPFFQRLAGSFDNGSSQHFFLNQLKSEGPMQELSFDSRHELVPRVREPDRAHASSDEGKLVRVRHRLAPPQTASRLCLSLRRFRFNGWTPNLSEDQREDEEYGGEPAVGEEEEWCGEQSDATLVPEGGVDAELTNLGQLHASMEDASVENVMCGTSDTNAANLDESYLNASSLSRENQSLAYDINVPFEPISVEELPTRVADESFSAPSEADSIHIDYNEDFFGQDPEIPALKKLSSNDVCDIFKCLAEKPSRFSYFDSELLKSANRGRNMRHWKIDAPPTSAAAQSWPAAAEAASHAPKVLFARRINSSAASGSIRATPTSSLSSITPISSFLANSSVSSVPLTPVSCMTSCCLTPAATPTSTLSSHPSAKRTLHMSMCDDYSSHMTYGEGSTPAMSSLTDANSIANTDPDLDSVCEPSGKKVKKTLDDLADVVLPTIRLTRSKAKPVKLFLKPATPPPLPTTDTTATTANDEDETAHDDLDPVDDDLHRKDTEHDENDDDEPLSNMCSLSKRIKLTLETPNRYSSDVLPARTCSAKSARSTSSASLAPTTSMTRSASSISADHFDDEDDLPLRPPSSMSTQTSTSTTTSTTLATVPETSSPTTDDPAKPPVSSPTPLQPQDDEDEHDTSVVASGCADHNDDDVTLDDPPSPPSPAPYSPVPSSTPAADTSCTGTPTLLESPRRGEQQHPIVTSTPMAGSGDAAREEEDEEAGKRDKLGNADDDNLSSSQLPSPIKTSPAKPRENAETSICPESIDQEFINDLQNMIHTMVGDVPFSQECSSTTVQDDTIKLVDKPKQIGKLNIEYSRCAKKIDIKKLKNVMWTNLSENLENNGQMKFTSLFSVVKAFLKSTNNRMAPDLSVHIAYVCLLYLANEKTLQLNNLGDGLHSDIIIKYLVEGNH